MTSPQNGHEMVDLLETDGKAIAEALQGLKFGVVTVIVQDGVIVQIDRTEKRRFRRKSQVEPTPYNR